MKPNKAFFFAPWFKTSDQQWLIACSLGIVFCAWNIGSSATNGAFYWFGFRGNENVLAASLMLATFFAILGLISGIRLAEASCIGCCAALSDAGIQYALYFQAASLIYLSFLVPSLSILWLLGHHPLKE